MLLHVPGDFEDDPDHRGIVILYMYMHERSARAFPLKHHSDYMTYGDGQAWNYNA